MSGAKTQPSQQISQQQQAMAPWMTDLAKTQAGQATTAFARSQETLNKSDAALTPVLQRLLGLASGNASTVAETAAPELKTISQGADSAFGQIMEGSTPGAGRDFAMSMLPVKKAGAVSDTLNKTRSDAFSGLSGLSQILSGQGLDWFGGGLRATEGAGQTYSGGANILSQAEQTQRDVMQAQSARQQSLLGFFGQLAGTAGGVASKFIKP